MSDEFNPLNVDSEDWRYWKPYGKPFRDKIPELERTDMDKMRAQAIADADDLTALVERPAADVISVRGFESVLSTFRKQILISKKDADSSECVLIEMYKRAQQAKESAAPVQQAPAEAVQQVGNFESCWAICEETGYANDQELAKLAFKAGQAAAIPEGVVLVPIDTINDALSGWRYIRESHGDLYGVGWGRVQAKLEAAKGEKWQLT